MKEIKEILELRYTPGTKCGDIKRNAEEKVTIITERIELLVMKMKPQIKNTKYERILIEALFAPNCSSRDATLLMINKVSKNQAAKTDIKETTISSTPEANFSKFLGSPSIRINGKDIEPESVEKSDYGFG